jgi:hypothetical protein
MTKKNDAIVAKLIEKAMAELEDGDRSVYEALKGVGVDLPVPKSYREVLLAVKINLHERIDASDAAGEVRDLLTAHLDETLFYALGGWDTPELVFDLDVEVVND